MKANLYKGCWTAVLAVGLLGVAAGCRPAANKPVTEKLRFGLSPLTLSALPIIALEKGFFAAEGLEVAVVEYGSGDVALSGVFSGVVDVATCSEVPMVAASFRRKDFAAFACIGGTSHEHGIVARKDAGIEKPSDLRGKRVATVRATAMHLFLHLFLLHQKMPEGELQLSYLQPAEAVTALVDGRVDAISIREPYISQAESGLGARAVVFVDSGIYFRTQLAIASKAFLEQHPEAARRFVRGLLRAERFAEAEPDEARRIVAKRMGVEVVRLRQDWSRLQLKVSLRQSLFGRLEDEARWMLNTGLVPSAPIPNYLEFIDASVLNAVEPEQIDIIR